MTKLRVDDRVQPRRSGRTQPTELAPLSMDASRLALSFPVVREHAAPIAGYRPDIDGLRAIAIASVLIFHIHPSFLPGGYVGVDVFFVISGFLISGIISRGVQRGDFSFRDFYARRIRRIFPALVFVLLIVFGIAWLILLPDEFHQFGRDLFSGSAFLSNLILYRDTTWYFALSTPLLHLWSLGIEEQFYLVWPLFLVASWKVFRSPFRVVALVTVASFAMNILTVNVDPQGAFYLPWNRLWELCLGALLVIPRVSVSPISPSKISKQQIPTISFGVTTINVVSISGTLLIVASFIWLDDKITFPGWWSLIPVLGAVLIISAGPTGWVNRKLLSIRAIVFVGVISYPLYLWHWPLIALMRTYGGNDSAAQSVTAAVAALGLAIVTYKFIETPFRRLQNKTFAVFSLCGLMAICALLGLITACQLIPARSDFYNVERYVQASNEDWLPNGSAMPEAHWVRWAHWTLFVDRPLIVGQGPRRTLFIGDSNMQHYFLRINKLAHDHSPERRGAIFAARSGCGPVVVEMLRPIGGAGVDGLISECNELLRSALKYAEDPNVDTVVLSANWYWYLVESTAGGKYSSEKVLRELRDLIYDLVQKHKRVYLILNIPGGDQLDPRKMIHRSLFPPAFSVTRTQLNKTDVVTMLEPMTTKLRALAYKAGAAVIDPVEFLCSDLICPAVTMMGEPMYKNGGHLRPSYVTDNGTFLDETMSTYR